MQEPIHPRLTGSQHQSLLGKHYSSKSQNNRQEQRDLVGRAGLVGGTARPLPGAPPETLWEIQTFRGTQLGNLRPGARTAVWPLSRRLEGVDLACGTGQDREATCPGFCAHTWPAERRAPRPLSRSEGGGSPAGNPTPPRAQRSGDTGDLQRLQAPDGPPFHKIPPTAASARGGGDVHSLWASQGLESPLAALSPGSRCHTLDLSPGPEATGSGTQGSSCSWKDRAVRGKESSFSRVPLIWSTLLSRPVFGSVPASGLGSSQRLLSPFCSARAASGEEVMKVHLQSVSWGWNHWRE